MFEQPLYEFQPVASPRQESDLFKNYEVRNWVLSSRLYKILGISAVANILALLIVAQTSLLTMKGCDSPLVGSVCQVLDTVYVGSLLFGTEREYIDVAYDRTNLEDSDITFIDASHLTPPLKYPSGYFQIANPEQAEVIDDGFGGEESNFMPGTIPGFPGIPMTRPSTGESLFHTPQHVPKTNPDVVDGDLPSSQQDSHDSRTAVTPPFLRKRYRGGRVTAPRTTPEGEIPGIPDSTPKPDADATAAQKTPDPQKTVEPVTDPDAPKEDRFGRVINKRPLKDKAKETIEKVDANAVKLDSKFKVTVSGTLGVSKDGKMVVLKNPKPVVDVAVKNDPVMEKLVQDWILAVGDAGWLAYIDTAENVKARKDKRTIVFTVEQNDTDFFATIKAEQPDENVAKTMSSGLNSLLGLAAPGVDGDEQVFVKSASSTSEGKALVLNIHLPKAQVQEMIQRKLAEEKAKPKGPSGNAVVKSGNSTAIK